MPLKEIALKIKEAEKKKQKTVMFHFQTLIHADELKGFDAIKYCRDVGMNDSFAAEVRKMINLSQMIIDQGYLLRKL